MNRYAFGRSRNPRRTHSKFNAHARGPFPESADNSKLEPVTLDPDWTADGAFAMLTPEIKDAVQIAGYRTPSPIQEQCIPHILETRDLLGCAQTGTGKTAAFSLPLLLRLTTDARLACEPGQRGPRALVLAPTRELAAQIGDSFTKYGRFVHVRHVVIFGGVSQFHQVRAIERGVDILIATPGRLLDLLNQRHVTLSNVRILVLDEVDRMLDMGFLPDVKRVIALTPAERQTLLFSATMAPPIVELANTIVQNPVRITIAPDQPAVERITQKVMFVDRKNKDALLIALLNESTKHKTIVFTQMKHVANRVVEKLDAAGITGDAIHGNKSQAARNKALERFKKGHSRVLVATDVAARGIDIRDVTHVINYDLPLEAETYVHRIGRTARAGADGAAISLCCAGDRYYLRQIERLLGRSVPAALDHEFHCETTFRSTSHQPPPPRGGRQNRRARPSPHRRGAGKHRAH